MDAIMPYCWVLSCCDFLSENLIFVYTKTKAQISCVVMTHLISAFVFAAYIVYNLSTDLIGNEAQVVIRP